MSSEQIGYLVGVIVGGLVAGAFCGLLPLVLGLKKRREILAFVGWFSCVASGFILGLILAVPVSVAFTIVLLCLRKPEEDGNANPSSAVLP
jgi:hypothetical protein